MLLIISNEEYKDFFQHKHFIDSKNKEALVFLVCDFTIKTYIFLCYGFFNSFPKLLKFSHASKHLSCHWFGFSSGNT